MERARSSSSSVEDMMGGDSCRDRGHPCRVYVERRTVSPGNGQDLRCAVVSKFLSRVPFQFGSRLSRQFSVELGRRLLVDVTVATRYSLVIRLARQGTVNGKSSQAEQ